MPHDAVQDPASELLTFPCTQCGADLQFKAGTNSMKCPYCGHAESIAADQRPVVEYDFASGLAAMRRVPARALATDGKATQCAGCGAVAVITTAASRCAFCDAPSVVEIDANEEVFLPESLLPFGLDERTARDGFSKWVASRWFAPNDLKKRARTEKIDGVYLPYWTYDSQTTTRYTGMRGEHYWVNESYTDSNGKTQTRRVRKTRWYPAAGTVHVPFDDVLVCASGSLPRKLTESLEPWDLEQLRSFTPQFLSGFIAERYAVTLEQGFERAEERMDPVIRTEIRRDIGGDEQQILTTRIKHSNTTFKHLLLPAWISSYRYHDKVFRALVNARTGEVVGERPWSWVKITLTVLVVVAVIVTIVIVAKYR